MKNHVKIKKIKEIFEYYVDKIFNQRYYPIDYFEMTTDDEIYGLIGNYVIDRRKAEEKSASDNVANKEKSTNVIAVLEDAMKEKKSPLHLL